MTAILLALAFWTALVAFVAFRLGRAQAASDAKWQVDRLAEKWRRERREPPTERSNVAAMRGSRRGAGGLFQ